MNFDDDDGNGWDDEDADWGDLEDGNNSTILATSGLMEITITNAHLVSDSFSKLIPYLISSSIFDIKAL
jgi:hypothetical protein